MQTSQSSPRQTESEIDSTLHFPADSTSRGPVQAYQRIPFSRQPGLEQYNATRDEWQQVYRAARERSRRSHEPDSSTLGICWKAQLIVTFERGSYLDRLQIPIQERLAAKKLIDEISGD